MMNEYDELMATGKAPAANEYDQMLQEGAQSNAAALRQSMSVAASTTPDRSAEIIKLSDRTKVPGDVVERNFDRIKRDTENENDYDAMIRQSPRLSEWLKNGENAAVARDDVANLGALEWLMTSPSRAFRRGQAQVDFGSLRHQSLMRDLTEAEHKRLGELRAEMQKGGDLGAQNWFSKSVVGGAQQLPMLFGGLLSGAKTGLPTALGAAGAAALAGQLGPQALLPEEIATIPTAALTGYYVGQTVGAARFGFEQEAGHAYEEFLQLRDEAGQPLDPSIARASAIAAGAINAGLEAFQLNVLLRSIPGADKLAGAATRSAIKQALAVPTVRAALFEMMKLYGTTLAKETITEVAQRAVTIMSGELGKAASGQDITRRKTPDIMADLATEAVQAAQAFTFIVAPGPVMRLAQDAVRVQEAKKNEAFFLALGDQTQQSKLLQRMPEKMREFIAQATKDGPIENVYVPPEAWNTYWQDHNLDPRAVAAEVTGDVEAYDNAVTSGIDLSITIADYAAKIAPTEHNAFFAKELKLNPDEMSAREAQEFEARIAEEAKAVEQTPQAQQVASAEAAISQVREDITTKLVAAGVEKSTAEAYATTYEAAFKTVAERAGLDPLQLYQKYNLQVGREGITEQPGRTVMAQTQEKAPLTEQDVKTFEDRIKTETGLEDFDLRLLPSEDIRLETMAARKTGTGIGTKAMESLIKFADENNKRLVLSLAETGFQPIERGPKTTSRERLRRFYKRFGFVDNRGRNKNFRLSIYDSMYRNPQTARGEIDPLSGEVFFQSDDKKRGAISFGTDRQFRIDMLEGADLSTFLHESGHFWLEVLGDVISDLQRREPDTLAENQIRMVDDYDKLLKWFGVTSREKVGVEQHEKFARGIEAYFREGKAPSVELRSAFARFRAWLLAIYRSLRQLNANLTPEVREVMDRIFATDQEIEAAQKEAEVSALFADDAKLKEAGFDQAFVDAYRRQVQRASDTAKDELQQKIMRQLQREREAWWQGEREKVRDEIAQEVYQRREYVALAAMREPLQESATQETKRDFSPTLLSAITKLGGIDIAQIRDITGETRTGKDVKGIPPGLFKKNGRGLDDLATMLSDKGYSIPVDDTDGGVQVLRDMIRDEIDGRAKHYIGGYEDNIFADEMMRRHGGEQQIATVKLDRRALAAIYGDAFYKTLPRGTTVESGGVHPDVAAGIFGFTSGDELVKALKAAPPVRGLIESQADFTMRDRYGDMLVDGTLIDAARAAVQNEERAKVIEVELRALSKLQAVSAPAVAVAGRQARAAQAEGVRALRAAIPPINAIRAMAEGRISQMLVRALKPATYLMAGVKASREAITAAAKDDYSTALRAKQRELLNIELYRAAVKAKDEIDATAEYMAEMGRDRKRARIAKSGQDYLDQIDGFLDRYEFARVSLKTLERRKNLSQWIAEKEKAGEPVNLPDDVIDDARRQNYKELSVEALRGVRDSVKHIEHLSRLKNRLLTAKKQRDLKAVKDEIATSIRDNSKGARGRKIETRLPSEEGKRFIDSWFAMHRKLSSFVRQLDGFKDGGPVWEYFLRPINEAADRETAMNAEATRKLFDIFEVYKGRDAASLYTKAHIPAINESLTKMGRIMIALNWGNEGNRQKLMDGYEWNESQVKAILDTLDERDWQFVQSVFDFVNSYWPQIKAKEERVNGIAPDKVDAMPIQTRFGEFAGGYFPIKYDDRQSPRAYADRAKEAAEQSMKGNYSRATTRRGHTKERIEGVKRPMRLDFGVIFEHTNQVIHDISHHEMLIDVNRLLGSKEIQQAIIGTHGDVLYKQFQNIVTDIAAGDIPSIGAFEKSINWLRQGVTIAGLGWNVFTAILQPFGLSQSMVRIGPKWVAKGIGRWMRDAASLENTAAWIQDKSPMMKARGITQMREINEIRNHVGVRSGRITGWIDEALRGVTFNTLHKQAVVDSFFWMIYKGQQIADIPTWIGSYEKAMAQGNDEARSIALADQAVVDSQGGGMMKDLAGIQRGGPLLKLWTNFYSYFNVTWNLSVESTRRTNFRNPIAIGRLAVDFLLLYTLPATLAALTRHALTGPDDDPEKIAEALIRENLSYMTGVMIGLREVSSVIQGFGGYSGPAGTRFFSSISNLVKQVEQGDADAAFWRALNATAGIVLHYPAGQLKRSVEGYVALQEGTTKNPLALLVGPPRD